jgi:ATP-dependent Clp protease ATP-binding subunit ClpB
LSLLRRNLSDSNGRAYVNPRAAVGAPASDALKKYTVDLTQRARDGKLDPVIGRDEEMSRTIEVLSRRTKNNPVLIGEPGVGKTAIAEGLALRIMANEVPESLKNKRVLSLDLAALIAGTQFRGEFEERFKSVISEVEKAGDVVLFCDEMHTLVGAGAAGAGTMDASNMLKPALARGDLHLLGATTLDEYRKHVEKDGALARRFQPVFVKEPTVEDTVSIIRGLKEKYEIHHGVKIRDSAVVAAATLAQRYLTERKLPDKAIDLLDEAAARLRMQQESKPEVLANLERQLITRRIEVEALKKESDPASVDRRGKLEAKLVDLQREVDELTAQWNAEREQRDRRQRDQERLEALRLEMEKAMRSGNYQRASEIKYRELPELERAVASSGNKSDSSMLPDAVTEEDVAAVVSRHTGIPVSRLIMGEREKLLHMEDALERKVVGQRHAVEAISNAVRVARAGLHSHTKPIGCFLFLGPSGVGKTELAKALAEFMFNDPGAMVRIDMSEYMEAHSVARLIGAPPGYVGYDEGGLLTEAVRRRPYQVILLDEAEKAHKQVMNLMLQVFDEGRLTDSHGRRVDFRNTVIIMTSNLGAQLVASEIDRGQLSAADRHAAEIVTMNAVKAHFPPEFINRLDQIVLFNRLRPENMPPIVDIQLNVVRELLRTRRVELTVTDAAKEWLARVGFDPNYGARPLKRAVQTHLLNPLSTKILEGRVFDDSEVVVDVEGESLGFTFVRRQRPDASETAPVAGK